MNAKGVCLTVAMALLTLPVLAQDTARGHGTRVFEIVFEDDPFLTDQVRSAAARPGSFYSLRGVQRDPGGIGRLIQDVLLQEEPSR